MGVRGVGAVMPVGFGAIAPIKPIQARRDIEKAEGVKKPSFVKTQTRHPLIYRGGAKQVDGFDKGAGSQQTPLTFGINQPYYLKRAQMNPNNLQIGTLNTNKRMDKLGQPKVGGQRPATQVITPQYNKQSTPPGKALDTLS